jgi:hypothetical protein
VYTWRTIYVGLGAVHAYYCARVYMHVCTATCIIIAQNG